MSLPVTAQPDDVHAAWLPPEAFRARAARLDPAVYDRVRERLDEQLRSAEEWREQVNAYFFRKSGVPDARGRPLH
ncbi:hypothetical protein [Micromonospora sp. AMSO31t]|uniref:hypothetical protein n=1 Tax=Micromonospora sp. AMSO31t TaxID=2650566 RepID=UPI001CEC0D6F|nr:hypothetical protein [Micromonospora sp. AMSO31t]